MAWNEPGKDKNPWSNGGGGNKRPPELDEIVRNLQRRFGSVLGGGRGEGDGPPSGGIAWATLGLIALAAWVVTGFYQVDASSRGVVTRFGKFLKTTEPGLRWRPRGIDAVQIVNVDRAQEFNHGTSMLTGDANIIDIDLNVQYVHTQPKAFAFNVRDPEQSVRQVTEAAIRAVVGKYPMEQVQTDARDAVAQETKEEIQRILDGYDIGISVLKVNLNNTEFPEPVRESVQDVIKASRDNERYILEAEAYRNDILPKARGTAARQIQDAEAYRDRAIADAEGEAARFEKLLAEYEKAPEVTRERLYLEAIEDVYGNTSKVLMDAKGSGNLLYLPVDKFLEGAGEAGRRRSATVTATPAPAAETSTTRRNRDEFNARGRSRERN